MWTVNRIIPSAYLLDNRDGCLFNFYSDLSVVASLFFPFTSSLVIKVGKLNTPDMLCFHLVVTVTPKHWAVVNEIPLYHQSLADKEGIVVVFERRGGMCWLSFRLGALCSLELRPGCLHCSPDTGTDSCSVQRERVSLHCFNCKRFLQGKGGSLVADVDTHWNIGLHFNLMLSDQRCSVQGVIAVLRLPFTRKRKN